MTEASLLERVEPLLEIVDVSKGYGAVPALRRVSLSVQPGEVFGIVGESGSGKSTLLRLLHLEEVPDRGSYRLRVPGVPAGNLWDEGLLSRREIQNRHLGIVYQHPHLGLRMRYTSSGNIAARLLLAGERCFGSLRTSARASLATSEFPLERMDDLPYRLSGGMQQRVQLAKAIALKPALILLDEPTSGLDLSVQARVLDTLRRLQQDSGLTMVLVSHDLGVIRYLSDRVLVMRQGEAVEVGLADQIFQDPQHPYSQQLVHAKL